MSRQSLADAIGMHRESVRRIELGRMRTRPRHIRSWFLQTQRWEGADELIATFRAVLAPDWGSRP